MSAKRVWYPLNERPAQKKTPKGKLDTEGGAGGSLGAKNCGAEHKWIREQQRNRTERDAIGAISLYLRVESQANQ